MKNNEPKNDDQGTAGIDFLDFLFTLAISVGLSPGILGIEGSSGLLAEDWLQRGLLPQTRQAWFDLAVFTLGFLTLTLSWFGYHGSILKKRLKYGTLPGMFRFVCDVLLVVIYGWILLEYKRFSVVLRLIVLCHAIFVVWDVVKIIEHWDKYKSDKRKHFQKFRREYISLGYFVMFLVVWYLVTNIWLGVSLAILLTILYRVNKELPLLERFFGVKTA